MATERLLHDESDGNSGESPPSVPEALRDAEASLQDVFARALALSQESGLDDDTRHCLRRAIFGYTTSCRSLQITPEATLVGLKRTLSRVSPSMIDARPTTEHDAELDFIEQIIGWCIADYYRDD